MEEQKQEVTMEDMKKQIEMLQKEVRLLHDFLEDEYEDDYDEMMKIIYRDTGLTPPKQTLPEKYSLFDETHSFDVTARGIPDVIAYMKEKYNYDLTPHLDEPTHLDHLILPSNLKANKGRLVDFSGTTNKEAIQKILVFYKHKTIRRLIGPNTIFHGSYYENKHHVELRCN